MSNWSSSYRIAGLVLDIDSSAGDPTAFLPPSMSGFADRGPAAADLTIVFRDDEEAHADPLRRFFPSQFVLSSSPGGLSFDGVEGRRKGIGLVSAGCARAVMGLPPLDRQWRIPEEKEAVREAVQAFVRACLQCRLVEEGGTMMHAAGIAWEGKGFVFTGHTRSGKTTLSRDFPLEAVLGDDLVAVRGERGGFVLYGTPWAGREGGATAYGGVPLRSVFTLHPGLEAGLHAQSPGDALAELIANAPRMGYEEEESKLLGVFSSLVEAVPIYRLSIELGDDAMPYIRQISSEEGGGDRSDRQ